MLRNTPLNAWGRLTLAILLLAGLVFLPRAAEALEQIFHVNNAATLRQAITAINNGGSSTLITEAIILLAPGDYALSGDVTAEDNSNLTGDLDIFPGDNITAVTIESNAAGAAMIIDGAETFRLFDVFPKPGADLSINFNNVIIQNGKSFNSVNASNDQSDGYGGGIFIRPSAEDGMITVTMDGVNLLNNVAQASGGGIAIGPRSALVYRNGTIADNRTEFNGGGVFCFACSATLQNTQLIENRAGPPTTGIGGGAVFNAGGTLTIDDASIIADNTTAEDGLYVYGGAVAQAGFGTTSVSAAITADGGNGSGIFNQFGRMIVNFPDINPVLPGDAVILEGRVTFNVKGQLTILGDTIQPAGEFIIRHITAMPWLPLLLSD